MAGWLGWEDVIIYSKFDESSQEFHPRNFDARMKQLLPNFFLLLLEASYSCMLFLHDSNVHFFNVSTVFYVLSYVLLE